MFTANENSKDLGFSLQYKREQQRSMFYSSLQTGREQDSGCGLYCKRDGSKLQVLVFITNKKGARFRLWSLLRTRREQAPGFSLHYKREGSKIQVLVFITNEKRARFKLWSLLQTRKRNFSRGLSKLFASVAKYEVFNTKRMTTTIATYSQLKNSIRLQNKTNADILKFKKT